MSTLRAIILGALRLSQGGSQTSSRQSSTVAPSQPTQPPADAPPPKPGKGQHATSKFDKWLLEHFKKYPKGQAPDFINPQTMEKFRSKGLIKLNLVMGGLTLLGIAYYVYRGKKERAAGYSLAKMNLDWHAEQNQKSMEEIEKKEKER